MKRAIIIALSTILGLAGTPLAGRAQSPAGGEVVRERMYVSTDKDNYLAGEIVWMKLLTVDAAGVPLVFSKVGYVELVGESDSHARARIDIRGGTGEGTLVIPATLPTGWYRLVGYTRWMRNEGPEVFFDKRVGVVNPAMGEVPRGSAVEPDPDPDPDPTLAAAPLFSGSGGVRVTADRDSYPPRGEVRLEVTGIPADIHTLAVGVTAADPLGGYTRPGLGDWRPAPVTGIPATGTDDTAPATLDPEWEGAIVTGRLVSVTTGERTFSPAVLPLASFPGDAINLFGGEISRDGSILFRTSRAAGYNEIVTTMRGSGSEPLRIDVDDPFADTEGVVRPMPTFPVGSIDRESVEQASFAMQVQYSYANDSLTLAYRPTPLFTDTPHSSYKMEEWRRFATMNEVFVEFIKLVQFRGSGRDNDRRYLTVINPDDFGTLRASALVLLDGVPIMDHDIIYNYNPLLIDRIDVFNGRYTFGNNVFFGIVALYTARNSYPELRVDPSTQIASYTTPQASRRFYAPDYSDPARAASHLPDFRHTLYWNADVAVDGNANGNGSANVTFHTSDQTGSWQVLVEGVTAAGVPVSAVCRLEVR